MDGGKYPAQAWKVRVKQEFDVYLYFQEGILADDDEELHDIISEEAINVAFMEDGLNAVVHEETESSNGYLAFVITDEPTSEVVYNYKAMPEVIRQALKEKGFVHEE